MVGRDPHPPQKRGDQAERRCSDPESAPRTELGITCVVAENIQFFRLFVFRSLLLLSIVFLSNVTPHSCCVSAQFSLSVQFSGLLKWRLLGVDAAQGGIQVAAETPTDSGPDRYLWERLAGRISQPEKLHIDACRANCGSDVGFRARVLERQYMV